MAHPASTGAQVDVSVIIGVHNPDGQRFGRVLAGLKRAIDAAGHEGITSELIVVRNGGNELPADSFFDAPDYRLMSEDRLGLAYARCAGLKAAAAALCVFIDDDTVVDADYLIEGVRHARAYPNDGVFGGRVVGAFAVPPAPWMTPLLPFLAIRDLGDGLKRVGPQDETSFDVPGAGMFLHTTVGRAFADMVDSGALEGIGRAGSSLASGDDTACCLIARRLGLALAYVPALRITHLIPAARLEPAYLARIVLGIGRSAAKLDRIFKGPDAVLVRSPVAILARRAVHIARHGWRAGRITVLWHVGYRAQAIEERARLPRSSAR